MKLSDHPKNITYRPEYHPDMARMIKALKILHEYQPDQDSDLVKEKYLNENDKKVI